LELVSLGINPTTGDVPDLELTCTEIAALMRRMRENRDELHEVLVGDDPELQAMRAEGRSGPPFFRLYLTDSDDITGEDKKRMCSFWT
jgi:hypothetical protein